MMYYTYMLRCEDNSVYTGITNDVKRRFKQHCEGKGAKYTRFHKPVQIAAVFSSPDIGYAGTLEYYIKALPKSDKEYIIQSKSIDILKYLVDTTKYKYEGELVD